MAVKQVNTQEFQESIAAGKVFADFFATWCMPCKMMSPILEEVSEKLEGEVTFVKIDVDECRDLAEKYGIMSIPTMIVFENGEAVKKLIGVHPAEEIEKAIKGA